MYIVHIASEMTPIAKAGGLADVIHGLCKELHRQGHQVEIILPKYDCLNFELIQDLKIEQRELFSYDGPDAVSNTVWSTEVHGLKVYLLEPHDSHHFFKRNTIYGCPDDIDRFNYFARAAMEFLFKTGKRPDCVHVHDWTTALIPVLHKHMYIPLGFHIGGTVLTIHNMQHQGKSLPQHLDRTGLRAENFLSADQMQDPLLPLDINLLKGGIVYADKISTVSPTYEKEIQTAEGAFGLQETLQTNRYKLKGILNGIDEEFWNPETDPYLAKTYPARGKIDLVLAGKKENRRRLCEKLGLRESNAPLISSVTRLVSQKNPELIKSALYYTLEMGGQFIFLGSTPVPALRAEFEMLQEELKGNKNACILLNKDEALAHQIYASSDMFIIPSRFEPCGLTQLIALRYGTIPVARMTGGLRDTVFDIDTSKVLFSERNGFTFDAPTPVSMRGALGRAMQCYSRDREKWKSIIINGMRKDLSWKKSAQEYIKLYQEVLKEKNLKQQRIA